LADRGEMLLGEGGLSGQSRREEVVPVSVEVEVAVPA